MEWIRLILLPVLLSTLVVGATANRMRFRTNNYPTSSFTSDAELLRALEFLDQYERNKNGESAPADAYDRQELPELYNGFEGSRNFAPFPAQFTNEIPPMFDDGVPPHRPLKWEDEEGEDDADDEEELAMEDFLPPRPEDLETNEAALAEAILEEYRDYEAKRQKELFNKILGDVMAEKLLQQDEEENIEKLMEEQEEEKQGLEDLADIFGPSSSASSSEADIELELPMFSASSEVDKGFNEDSQSSDVNEDDFDGENDEIFLSEAGLDALDEAERILKEGYNDQGEAESSESMPDFDDTSVLLSLLQDSEESRSSEVDESLRKEKEETLKDIIYRIVQDNLRRKLVEDIVGDDDAVSEESVESVVEEEESTSDGEEDNGKMNNLLDNLVDEIRDQVDELTSKIMNQIEDDAQEEEDEEEAEEAEADDIMTSQSEARVNGENTFSSSDGYFDDNPVNDGDSSSIPEEVIEEIMGAGLSSSMVADGFDTSSSVTVEGKDEEEESVSDEELINAIKEIVPAVQSKVCPLLNYLLDDCSVINGFKGLGSDGYREAFSRPCNRHQICYTCSTSYDIPTKLCDEIYKAELLTLCNGDPECKQRAKYFWFAATNDRTAPIGPLSLCNDRCVLDYLLSD